jgi:hypothetical protein
MYKKIFEQFSGMLITLRKENKKRDLMRNNRHVWGYITALADYNIISFEEFQALALDLRLVEGA